MANIIVELTTEKKYRNKSEYKTVQKATCDEFDASTTGNGTIIKDLALILHEKKCDISRMFEVRRGTTLVFELVPLKRWIEKRDNRPVWLHK